MGSAGHAFIAHTKALSPGAQTKDGGYGLPPHPLVVRPGQRFWPRRGRRRRPFVVRRVGGASAIGKRLDGNGEEVRVSLVRLLEVDGDGQGRHYRFQGWTPRRYDTFAWVWTVEQDRTVLCIPEWHPWRPAPTFTSLLPEPARRTGAWLALRCDLSAPTPGRLQPSGLRPVPAPPPAAIHAPALG